MTTITVQDSARVPVLQQIAALPPDAYEYVLIACTGAAAQYGSLYGLTKEGTAGLLELARLAQTYFRERL